MKLLVLIIAFYNFSCFAAFGQENQIHFEHLSVYQGLSNNEVKCILQDREGFMWFGTKDGLNKYDGYSFTVYKHNPADAEHTLHGSEVWDIHEDKEGRLWIATYEGGLQQIDKKTGKITAYPIDSVKASRWDELFSISEDRQGMLWLGTEKGLVKFDPATKEFTKYLATFQKHTNAMACLQEDPEGNFWAVNADGVFQFDSQTGKYMHFPLNIYPPDQWPLIFAFYLDAEGIAWIGVLGEGVVKMDTRHPGQFISYNPGGLVNKHFNLLGDIYEADGYLWLTTTEGLQRIDKKTDQVITYRSDPALPGSLSSNDVQSVYKDRSGHLWVGTSSGINKASTTHKPFFVQQIIPTPSPFYQAENYIYAIVEDHTGVLWLSSAYNELYSFDPQTNQIIHVEVKDSDSPSPYDGSVQPLHIDHLGRLWLGVNSDKGQALYLLESATGRFTSYPCEIPVQDIAEDPSGKLWIRGWSFGIASFDPQTKEYIYYKPSKDSTGLLPASVQDVMVSRTGEVWAGTYAGLSRLNPKTGKFKNYVQPQDASTGQLNDYKVLAIYEDKEGIIWTGTNEGGLNRLDPKTHTFTYYTTSEGLSSNHIESIIGDDNGNLWIGTNQGLSRFNPTNKTFRNFDISDGLPDNEFLRSSVYSRNGRLMFGTRNGFLIFHPDSIKDDTTAPPIYITGFKVLEKSMPLPEGKMVLSYQENFLSFEFVALNYNAPEKNQYAYKLEGVDKDWVYSGTRRFASYTNLDPGKYTFRVKASNNDGVWNEQGASLQLTILPPFWQTWWAYSLYALLALGTILSIRHYELKRVKLRQRAAHLSELDSLKSRFFANISHEFRTPLTLILGPLKALYEGSFTGDPKAAFGMMMRNSQRLLRLINQLLDISKLEAGKMQLKAKETDLVALLRHIACSYESLATEKKIRYFFYAEVAELPAYVDQEKIEKIVHNLLSNAFKFTAEGREVILYLKQEHQWALISVKDTGTGIPADQLEKVFDRFYQVDSSQTRSYEGSGIGMALAKELVELHHGRISVESKEGKGSTFTVCLPLGKAHLSGEEIIDQVESEETPLPADALQLPEDITVAEEEHAASISAATSMPLLLVVEDHADMRQYIGSILQGHYQIIEAAHGKEGVRKAQALLPDLIISDVMMPEMDGYQLCEKIKTDELTSHIPVILLTARADRQSKLSGLATGADDYLSKPFDAEELLLLIRNRIEERRRMRERFSRDITLEPRHIAITSLDEQFLSKVLDIIEAHMEDEHFTIEEMSRQAGYSHMHFYRKIKALTDHTPSQFLRSVRLKRAAAMLQKRSDHVTQIAYSVGFSSLSYFNKCFKEEFGMTPGQFAKADQIIE